MMYSICIDARYIKMNAVEQELFIKMKRTRGRKTRRIIDNASHIRFGKKFA